MKTQITGPIDLSPYLSSTNFSVQEGISLARALIASCPKGAPAAVKRAVEKLRRAADAAQTALSARQREDNQVSEEDGRLLDQDIDAAWRGLRLALEGLASLSPARVPRARRAAALLTQLFDSTGLSFLAESYSSQLTTMQALLQRIEEDKLEKEIDAVIGPEFLEEIREMLPRYERMVHGMLNRRSGSSENLQNHRYTLSRLVLAYATAICSTVDEEEPETVEIAFRALAPLDNQRAAMAGRRSAGQDSAEPTPDPATSPSEPSK